MIPFRPLLSCPVISLVLDSDLSETQALETPEMYLEMTKGRSISVKIFLIWLLISIYQGTTTTSLLSVIV
jgi:phospholipid-translocating ATPase